MGNMSYCRFENTLGDLADCVEVMQEVDYGNKRSLQLNEYEIRAFHAMAKYCERYIDLYNSLVTDNTNILPCAEYDNDDDSEDY